MDTKSSQQILESVHALYLEAHKNGKLEATEIELDNDND